MAYQLSGQHIALSLLILVGNSMDSAIEASCLDERFDAPSFGDLHQVWHELPNICSGDRLLSINEFSQRFLTIPARDIADTINRRAKGRAVRFLVLPKRPSMEISESIRDNVRGISLNLESCYDMRNNWMIWQVRMAYRVAPIITKPPSWDGLSGKANGPGFDWYQDDWVVTVKS